MFRDTLKVPVETLAQPFIEHVNLKFIQLFLKIVGYHGLVDKQKKDVIQYPRFTKLIIADIMSKFELVPKILGEEYHSIKDDTPLVSVYTSGKVTVKRMLIPADLITDEIQDTQEYKDYVEEFGGVDVLMIQPELVESTQGTIRTPKATRTDVEKIIEGEDEESYASERVDFVFLDKEDFGTRLEPESHKENPETIDDDDVYKKKDDKKDDDNDDDNDDHDNHAFVKSKVTGSTRRLGMRRCRDQIRHL
nr:hypothetical protein [Tanacetum cinerariifolium]